jgi:hypothetical protein
VEAGKLLSRLKENKPDGTTWEVYVKEMCGISRSRSDELIRIADGRTTVEETREKTREKVRAHRERQSPLRNGDASPSRDRGQPEEVSDDVEDDDDNLYPETMDEYLALDQTGRKHARDNWRTLLLLRIPRGDLPAGGCRKVLGVLRENFDPTRKARGGRGDAD